MFSVVSQTIVATPPLLSVKVAYRNPKTGLGGGTAESGLPLKPVALQGASYKIASPIAAFSLSHESQREIALV